MSRDQRYVLYCEFGLKSAHLADLMRSAGLDASHVRQGSATLMRDERDKGTAPTRLDSL